MQHKETIQDWIDTINVEAHNLTDFETNFMKSITEQFDEKGAITQRQEALLERIYKEKVK